MSLVTENTSTEDTTIEAGATGGEGTTTEVQETPTTAIEGGGEAAEIVSENADRTEAEGLSPTAYKPKLKFKADDKEHEVPKELASLIKDEATEKQVVELLQKAYGLDAVKGRAEQTRQQRDEAKKTLSAYDEGIKRLRDHYNRDDIDMWLAEMKADPNKILKWAMNKVEYSQLTPEQKAIRDSEVNSSRRAYELEQQNVRLQSESRETQLNAMQTALNYELGRPDVDAFQKSFDAKAGKSGAFFEAVKAKGHSSYTLSGGQKTLTPAEAIAEVMRDYAGFIQAPASATPANPNAPKVVQPNQAKNTIPNTQGKQTSPVGIPKPKNLRELRELANKANS